MSVAVYWHLLPLIVDICFALVCQFVIDFNYTINNVMISTSIYFDYQIICTVYEFDSNIYINIYFASVEII